MKRPTGDALLVLAAVLLAAASLHALMPFSPLPGWDLDPTMFAYTRSGVGPFGSMVLDLVIGACAAGMIGLAAGRSALSRLELAMLALVGAAAGAVVLHGVAVGEASWSRPAIGDLRIGFSWVAAVLGALAIAIAGAREERVRRVCVAAALGFIAVLALKGLHQVLVEHPRTMAEFAATRDRYFAAQGWSSDSPMARSYERRLRHSDATGWFALANVYASFAAAGTVAFAGLILASWRLAARSTRAMLGMGLAASVGALLLSQSKGGVIAAAAGVGVLCALWVVRRVNGAARLATIVGAAAVAMPLVLVAVRGVLGERLAHLDLSIYFRWFYLQAAARIFGEHPLTGVGPDGFQAAYAVAKPPLSPEDVVSPHSVLFDYAATLGVAGIGLAAVVVGLAVMAARSAGLASGSAETGGGRAREGQPLYARNPEETAVVAVAAVSMMTAFRFTPDLFPLPPGASFIALIVLPGLAVLAAAWSFVGIGVLRAMRTGGAVNTGLAAGALTLIAHGQIDVAPTWHSSAALWAVIIGSAAAPALRGAERAMGGANSRRVYSALAAVVVIGAGAAFASGAWRTRAFERGLRDAAERVAAIVEMNAAREDGAKADSSQAARDASQRLMVAVLRADTSVRSRWSSSGPRNAEEFAALVAIAEWELLTAAAETLTQSAAVTADQWKAAREASRLQLRAAEIAAAVPALGEAKREASLRAGLAAIEPWADARPARSGVLGAVATAHEARARLVPGEAAESRRKAIEALSKAAAADPYSVVVRLRLLRVARAAGHTETARRTAEELVALNPLKRLDPEGAGLSEAEMAEVRGVLGPAGDP